MGGWGDEKKMALKDGRGCMAIGGKKKTGGRTYGFGNRRYCKRSSRTENSGFKWALESTVTIRAPCGGNQFHYHDIFRQDHNGK